jgi:hypothetical protein
MLDRKIKGVYNALESSKKWNLKKPHRKEGQPWS